ncbi:hypothetical protein JST56_04910 [Candidatus Dependentiae bacterium]|nr:hypothetical protein [Candidatus Dependentiae bacterium]
MTIKCTAAILFIITISLGYCSAFHIDNLYSGKLGAVAAEKITQARHFFSPVRRAFNAMQEVVTEPRALLTIIKDTLRYFDTYSASASLYPTNDWLSCQTVRQTLEFVAATIERDLPSGNFRILDPEFIQENFKALKWAADSRQASKNNSDFPTDGRIRLTNYAVFCVEGSSVKTTNFPYALYQLRDPGLQKKYTKHQVLAGALDSAVRYGKAKPLVWLSRDGIEDALMQGTIAVRMPNGNVDVFGLDCDNGIVYDKAIKDPKDQKRYWFYRRVACSGAPANEAAKLIAQRAQVVFAGDIENLGIGKLIALKYPDPITGKNSLKLGVLADTGSAFSNNLYQLDLFAGLFTSRQHFSQYMKTSPQFADAFILYR